MTDPWHAAGVHPPRQPEEFHMTTPAVANDARNRAWRTFLQGLGFTVAAALVVSLLTAVGSATSWTEFGGVLVGFAFFQAIATSVLSWLMRTVLDGRLTAPPAGEHRA